MKTMGFKPLNRILFFFSFFIFTSLESLGQNQLPQELVDKIQKDVLNLMDEGGIPGLSLVVIYGERKFIKSYGYSDIEKHLPVNEKTLFEIGSCSKAFTALALLQLEADGHLNLDDSVSKYLTWFSVTYKGAIVDITLRQLMHHTSGIPSSTLSKIPESNEIGALESTVTKLVGQELDAFPGTEYQYATIGYDILGLVIQKVAGQMYETYLQTHIIDKLGLVGTTIGIPRDETFMSQGYKIGFYSPRKYQAPKYKGNNAAGYVISNVEDMGKWLEFQMDETNTVLSSMVKRSHQRDETVALHNMSSYAAGWQVALDGTGEIYHGGYNPNFTSYITFRPQEKLGVVVLANSNSTYTQVLGNRIMKILAKEEIKQEVDPGDRNDGMYSGISVALVIYSVVVLGYLAIIIVQATQRKRRFAPASGMILRFVISLLLLFPFLVGLYILPEALIEFSWASVIVWSPPSFLYLIYAITVAVLISYITFILNSIFPSTNNYLQKAPKVLLISILSGLSNVVVIIMVTSVIGSKVGVVYLVYYYVLLIGLYLFGRRYVQINLIHLTRGLVYDLRIQLVEKLFSTSYEKFETVDRGRIYTALNDDVNTIGQSTNLFVTLVTSVITTIGAFIYLAMLAFWATTLIILLILALTLLYYIAVQRTNKYFEAARDSRNVFMGMIHGLIEGFKEISLHRKKKLEYRDEVATSAMEFREKTTKADVSFVNAFLLGESLLIILLGLVSIGMSELFPSIEHFTIMSFVIVLLYLIGPVNSILNSVPILINLRISWNRISRFKYEIPANLTLNNKDSGDNKHVEKIQIHQMSYRYKSKDGEGFGVGPIDLELSKGDVLFIVGGNGSGKTTFAKLLTGLYQPDHGHIIIDGQKIATGDIGEYFSVVFNPLHLFDRLYNIDVKRNHSAIKELLRTLNLENKIEVGADGRFSTINLSGGQQKRLALLLCYLEDSPILLFDEWAADQDPEFRKLFYRTLIPEMSRMGKIVIAITHDDHYFDTADMIVRMDQGKITKIGEVSYDLSK